MKDEVVTVMYYNDMHAVLQTGTQFLHSLTYVVTIIVMFENPRLHNNYMDYNLPSHNTRYD